MKGPSKAVAKKTAPKGVGKVMKRSMKAKIVSKIATGVLAKSSVFGGRKEKTSGGLTKNDLIKNKDGRVVSKKRSGLARKLWAAGKAKLWSDAIKKARKALGLKGFVAVGGN